jgi:hypothetical protein
MNVSSFYVRVQRSILYGPLTLVDDGNKIIRKRHMSGALLCKPKKKKFVINFLASKASWYSTQLALAHRRLQSVSLARLNADVSCGWSIYVEFL